MAATPKLFDGSIPAASAVPGARGGGLTDDIMARADKLREIRSPWETEWKNLADYFLPSSSRGFNQAMAGLGPKMSMLEGPPSRDGSVTRRRYDSTALWAADRLASGVESLVTPQSERWHGLGIDVPLAPIPTIPEQAWLDRTRDYLFERRYDARSGFSVANQKSIKGSVVFGTSVTYVEEAFGANGRSQTTLPIVYRHTPLYECYLDVDHQNVPDTNFRRFSMSARNMVARWGARVSAKVQEYAAAPDKAHQMFEIIHAVMPRQERGARGGGMSNSAFASYYMEADSKHLIGSGGFHEFPYVIYYWSHADEGPYGESPAMLALDDVRGLNVMRKTAMRAMQQWVDPPIAAGHEGQMNRPNLNPRAMNYGAIDNQGNLKIRPILTAQNPAGVEKIIQSERETVRETMYVNLFQVLIQNPSMTATEAMLRANEKGELLGPSGAKVQMGLSRMVEREVAILARKEAFAPGALLEAPRSVQGRSISVRFTSPLDRLRKMAEVTGLVESYQIAGMIAQAKQDPSVFDRLDDDKSLEIIMRTKGAPASAMRSDEEVAAIREQRAAQQQQMQQLEMAKGMAETAKNAVPAAAQAQEMSGMSATAGR